MAKEKTKEKIALVVDSTCGYTEKEIKKMGAFFVPVIVNIDNKLYKDGVTILEEELVQKLNIDMKLKTSAPSIGEFEAVYREALKTHDKIFYFGYTSKMSGTWNAGFQAGKNEEFKGKFFTTETCYMSGWMYPEVLKLLDMIKKGATIEELSKVITDQNEALVGALTVRTLSYLKNGGRVSSVGAFLGNMLKISPIAVFKDGFIDPKLSGKARTFSKSKEGTITYLKKYWDQVENKSDYRIMTLISSKIPTEEKEEYIEHVKEGLGLGKDYVLFESKVGTGVVCHLGPEYMGIGMYLK